MLRRKPTRLELKLDDIEEFESMKKELEAQDGAACHVYKMDPSIIKEVATEVVDALVIIFVILRFWKSPTELENSQCNTFISEVRETKQNRKKQQREEGVMVSSSDVDSANGARDDAKVREKINERIGYRPNAHINKPFSMFGNLH